MTILAHRQQLVFVNHGTLVPAKGKVPAHYEDGDGSQIAVTPQPKLQEVPDWVRSTDTFKLAVKSGLIVEVKAVSPVPEVAAPAPPAKAEPVTGLSGNQPSRKNAKQQ